MNDLKSLVRSVIEHLVAKSIPIGVSNRHIHLSQKDYDTLFPRLDIHKKSDLRQIGEYATAHTLTLVGPKGSISNVRLLAPLRDKTQVEISMTDARVLGVKPPIALSGHLENAETLTLKSDFAQITIPCCIIAKRHIHLSPYDAKILEVKDGEIVRVQVESPQRTTVFDDVVIRCKEGYVREMHLDTDEANAAEVGPTSIGRIVK